MAGRGSIEKRGKTSYRLEYNINGKRKRKNVQAKNKTEARKFLNEFIAELEAGEYIDPSKMKFGDFVDEWKSKYAIKHLSPTTLENYNYTIKGHILPVLANKRLDEIKPIHIINYMDSISRKDGKELSSSSLQYHHRILKNIFSRATEWKLIKSNPVDGVKRPKVKHKKTDVYTTEEVKQLLTLLTSEVEHQRLIITLALTTGMRRGEIVGLQWEDIDFDTNTIHIRHSLQYTKEDKYILKEPKTKSSNRSVVVPAYVMKDIKKYYHTKKKERLKAAELWEGGSHFFVFSTWNGKPFNPSVATTWWKRFIKRTGYKKIRFHDLRHTAATLLINQGAHTKIISERLGHSKIGTTMDIYGHYLQEADQEVANKLDELLRPSVL